MIKNQSILKNAAIYARVSSQRQKEEDTIDSQIEAIKLYAKEKGYHVNERYIFLDNGFSGGSLQRPALDELRELIRFETIATLLIYAPDRLSRNYTHQLILMEEFRKQGVEVCFLKNPPSSDTPEAKMFQHFQGIFAEYERALIVDRARRGRIYKAKQGDVSVIPSLPYGYRRIKNGGSTFVEVVEEEAKVVKEIFRLCAYETLPVSKIAQRITMTGIKPRKGGSEWSMRTILDILKNPTYLGTSYFGKTERCEGSSDKIRKYGSKIYVKAKYARRVCQQDKWLPINVPQIINENDFELVQEALKKNKILASRNTKEPSLLQGLITCGICGQPFYKRIRKNGEKSISYYNCRAKVDKKVKKCLNKSIRQEEIDKHVFEEVLKLLKTPALIQQELDRRAKEASNVDELRQQEIILRKGLAKLLHERDRLLDAYQSGVIDLKELKKRNKQLDEQKKKFEKDIESLQAVKIQEKEGFELGNIFENIIKRMEHRAQDLTFEEKRKLIRLLVEEVVIHKDTISLVHCISPIAIAQDGCLLKADGRI